MRRNKVEVTIDFITSIGNKITLTLGAEAQARSGHDIMAFDQYAAHQYADKLMPVNDVVDGLVKQYGPVSKAVEYLGVAYAALQATELFNLGAPGIHFYTLNRSPATRAIVSALIAGSAWRPSFDLSNSNAPKVPY